MSSYPTIWRSSGSSPARPCRPLAQLRGAEQCSQDVVWSSRHRVLPARPHPRARAPSARSGRASGLAAAAIAALALALAPGLASARKLAHGGAKSARGPSVSAALLGLDQSGAITPASYQHDYRAYLAAKRSLGRLGGTRRVELGAVLANVEAIAAAGGFTTSRLPALFLTLERNRQWWTTEPLLANGARVWARSEDRMPATPDHVLRTLLCGPELRERSSRAAQGYSRSTSRSSGTSSSSSSSTSSSPEIMWSVPGW